MRLREVEFHISGPTAAGGGNPELFPLPRHAYNCPMAAFTDQTPGFSCVPLLGNSQLGAAHKPGMFPDLQSRALDTDPPQDM